MSRDALQEIYDSMADLETRFVSGGSMGQFLRSGDAATFKRLVLEAKAMIDAGLGEHNDFSVNLVHAANVGSNGFVGGPSLSAVRQSRELIRGAMNEMARRTTTNASPHPSHPSQSYVDATRLADLRSIVTDKWDLRRLIRMIEELNSAYASGSYMSTAMLVRAIVDHVPPVFACANFNEVANNYSGGKSFGNSMKALNSSLRNIADSHLHVQMRHSESLPNATQVDFRANLDVLLAEVARVVQRGAA